MANVFRKVRLVTFDITNTLLRFRISPGQQYAEVAARCGEKLDGAAVSADFKRSYRAMADLHPNFGRASRVAWDEWWRRVVRDTLRAHVRDPRTVDRIAQLLIDSYKSEHYWLVKDGCLELLNFLKDCGVIVGIISNFDPRLRDILSNVGLREHFHFMVISYEAGFAKPDKEVFLKAIAESRMTGMAPSNALHVGDNPVLDYKGALEAGWQAALVTPKPTLLSQNVFKDLEELHRYFKSNSDIFGD